MGWFGSIFNARESESESLSGPGNDGNYEYLLELMVKVTIQ